MDIARQLWVSRFSTWIHSQGRDYPNIHQAEGSKIYGVLFTGHYQCIYLHNSCLS